MYVIRRFLIISFLLPVIVSCDTDFKAGSGDEFGNGGYIFFSDQVENQSISLNIEGSGNDDYYIFGHPVWMEPEAIRGRLVNGKAEISVSFNDLGFADPQGLFRGTLVVSIGRQRKVRFDLVRGNFENLSGNPKQNIIHWEGEVRHALQHPVTGDIYLAVSNPDQIIQFSAGTHNLEKIPLASAPAWMDISEDGKQIALACKNKTLVLFNTDSRSFVGEFSLDFMPFSVALGENNWCYLTVEDHNWSTIFSLDLSNGQINLMKGNGVRPVHGKAQIWKIPGMSFLVSTSTTLAPTGLMLIDISQGVASSLIDYYHKDLGWLWIDPAGRNFISANGDLFEMPGYQGGKFIHTDLNLFGNYRLNNYILTTVAWAKGLSSIFIAQRNAIYNNFQYDNNSIIQRHKAGQNNPIKVFSPSLKIMSVNGEERMMGKTVSYLFLNKQENSLYSVQFTKQSGDTREWSLEWFEI